MNQKKIRVLIAKPGLDGHDRGAKVVALALKEDGMEVIYTGLRQTIDQIVQTALEEDVDVVGLSILSGAHLPICIELTEKFREAGAGGPLVVAGGNIPRKDIEELKAAGVKGVFPTGSRLEEIVSFIRENARDR